MPQALLIKKGIIPQDKEEKIKKVDHGPRQDVSRSAKVSR
jgi:hypothetical protein